MRAILILLPAAILAGCQSPDLPAFQTAAAELPAAEAAAKAAGIISDGSQLMPNPAVEPKDNAAPGLSKAAKMIKTASAGHKEVRMGIEKLLGLTDKASLKDLHARLAVYDPALDAAVTASKLPRIDYFRNWASPEPWNITFPEFADIKEIVKLLSFRATLRAATGNPDGSISDLAAGFRISRLVGQEPILIAGLVEIATAAIVLRQVEYGVSARPNDTRFLKNLRQLVASQPERLDLWKMLGGETVFGTSLARRLATMNTEKLFTDMGNTEGEAPQEQLKILPNGVPRNVLSKAYLARALQLWVKLAPEVKDEADPVTASKKLDAAMQEIDKSKDPTQNLNRLIYPVFSQVGPAIARRTANLRTATGLIDVMLYRQQYGKLPASLAQAGFHEIDPFTGKPLKLLTSKGEVRVYSIGDDGIDNSGQTFVAGKENNGSSQRDVSSVYPRPDKNASRTGWP